MTNSTNPNDILQAMNPKIGRILHDENQMAKLANQVLLRKGGELKQVLAPTSQRETPGAGLGWGSHITNSMLKAPGAG